MSEAHGLSTAFIRSRPQAAASVVATWPIDDARSFVESIQVREAVDLLSAMSSRAAANIVVPMAAETSKPILKHMAFPVAASMLRQVAADERRRLLDMLPGRRRRDFIVTLSYAPDTVGGTMLTSIDVLLTSDRVSDALRVKRDPSTDCPESLFVVNDDRQLVGVVAPLALLRQPEAMPLAELADHSVTAVSPHLRLSSIATLEAWNDSSCLPVVSQRRELLGAIRRSRVLATAAPDTVAGVDRPMALSLLEVLGQGAMDLLDALPSRTAAKRGARHGR